MVVHRVKHIRKLERVIEDIRDSASTSHRREWTFLWDKIQDLIVQDREDSNAQSVLKSLQAATPQAKTKAVPAVPPTSQPKAPPPKTSTAPPAPSSDVAKAAAAPTTKPKPKPKPRQRR